MTETKISGDVIPVAEFNNRKRFSGLHGKPIRIYFKGYAGNPLDLTFYGIGLGTLVVGIGDEKSEGYDLNCVSRIVLGGCGVPDALDFAKTGVFLAKMYELRRGDSSNAAP